MWQEVKYVWLCTGQRSRTHSSWNHSISLQFWRVHEKQCNKNVTLSPMYLGNPKVSSHSEETGSEWSIEHQSRTTPIKIITPQRAHCTKEHLQEKTTWAFKPSPSFNNIKAHLHNRYTEHDENLLKPYIIQLWRKSGGYLKMESMA